MKPPVPVAGGFFCLLEGEQGRRVALRIRGPTSNDNPYSEAHFKTLKYRPAFPDRFGSTAIQSLARYRTDLGVGQERHRGHRREMRERRRTERDASRRPRC
jgi:hypothetical protein